MNSLKEEELILSWFESITVEKAWWGKPARIVAATKQRNVMSSAAGSFFFPFYFIWAPSHGMVPPMFRVGLRL
jgi:hypothetical protein